MSWRLEHNLPCSRPVKSICCWKRNDFPRFIDCKYFILFTLQRRSPKKVHKGCAGLCFLWFGVAVKTNWSITGNEGSSGVLWSHSPQGDSSGTSILQCSHTPLTAGGVVQALLWAEKIQMKHEYRAIWNNFTSLCPVWSESPFCFLAFFQLWESTASPLLCTLRAVPKGNEQGVLCAFSKSH